MNTTHVVPLGWDMYIQKSQHLQLNEDLGLGRISEVYKDQYTLLTGQKEITGILSGRFYYDLQTKADLPAVGDWVQFQPIVGEDKGIIQEILPRLTMLSRKDAGQKTTEQVIAANVDILFIVQGLDNDFNPRRLERYLLMAFQNNIQPVILLNKSDLLPDIAEKTKELEHLLARAAIHNMSALHDNGLENIWPYLTKGTTAVFLGSSGAGKSTILNRLLGEDRQKVRAVREDDSRGKHTTTTRHMFQVKSGALVIDTPGMRELEPWSADEGLASLFPEIEEYAQQCRYSDCSHQTEPGCAVLQAIADNFLSEDMLKSYHKLGREQEYQRSRTDEQAFLERKKKEKSFHKQCRMITRDKNKKRGDY